MSNEVVRAMAHPKTRRMYRKAEAHGPPKQQSGRRILVTWREKVTFYPNSSVNQIEKAAKLSIQLGQAVPMFGSIKKLILKNIKLLIKLIYPN